MYVRLKEKPIFKLRSIIIAKKKRIIGWLPPSEYLE